VEVQRLDLDYYTRPILRALLQIVAMRENRPGRHASAAIAEVLVSWSVVGFRRIKFYTHDNLGVEPVSMPEQKLSTMALVLEISSGGERARWMGGALAGLEHVLHAALPLLVMCDKSDLMTWQQAGENGTWQIFLYDRFPGGLGLAERAFEQLEQLLAIAHELIAGCPCESGCPSCVGLGTAMMGEHQLQLAPEKASTRRLLEELRDGW
jgi:DEAD/DEAH box helicase domain-containing protein